MLYSDINIRVSGSPFLQKKGRKRKEKMGKALYKKMNSSVGASLAIALLLFLACSVVGTVVLTAASAVSGRAAELTFMDQRYHSVASAAALLEKELCGKEVTIVRTKIVTEWDITEYTLDDEEEYHRDFEVTYSTVINGYKNDENPWPTDNFFARKTRSEPQKANLENGISLDLTGKSFLTRMAVNLLFGDSSDGRVLKCNTEEALEYTFADTTSPLYDEITGLPTAYCNGTILLEPGSDEREPDDTKSDDDYHALRAVCEYTLRKDGALILIITDKVPIPESLEGLEHYTLTITLFPEFDETPLMTKSTEEFNVKYDDRDPEKYTETLTTTTTQTRTSTVKWKTTAQE